MDENRVIGNNGKIPWYLPEDLKLFKKITTGMPVVMGRRTWESLPDRFRPLPSRSNIVLTTQSKYKAPGALVVSSVKDAFQATGAYYKIAIIGGAKIYKAFLPCAQNMYISHIHGEFDGDTYFPEVKWSEWNLLLSREYDKASYSANSHSFTFAAYERRNKL